MTDKELCRVMHCYLAKIAPAGPALRNQGAKGMAKAAQAFFRTLDLASIPSAEQSEFAQWLDEKSEALCVRFPRGGRHWGAARKVMNLFLRHACYNVFVRKMYGLHGIEPWLEVPLDSIVAAKLRHKAGHGKLPHWPGLKKLDKVVSREYQSCAAQWANELSIARVHLDPLLWGGGEESQDT